MPPAKPISPRGCAGFPPHLAERCEAAGRVLAGVRRVAVAYSGGVDSTFLAVLLRDVLGRDVLTILVSQPFLGEGELRGARETARELGFSLLEAEADPLSVAAVRENPPDRCYHCKRLVMEIVRERAREAGFEAVCDGTNADDLAAYRPGGRALRELGVLSPLAEAGFAKKDVREASRLLGLRTWDKPAFSCLATRFPYGTALTAEGLSRVERAEEAVRRATGRRQVRVRVHGDVARIEVSPEAFPEVLARREEIARGVREAGFRHVALDLLGYRSGSFDEPPSGEAGHS